VWGRSVIKPLQTFQPQKDIKNRSKNRPGIYGGIKPESDYMEFIVVGILIATIAMFWINTWFKQ